MFQIQKYFKYLEIKKGDSIADFGCGIGQTSILLSKNYPESKICSIDVDEQNLYKFKLNLNIEENKGEGNAFKNVNIIWGDIEEVDGSRLLKNSVDVGIVENTLYTLKNKKSFLLELKRVLRSKAKVLIVDFYKPLGKSIEHQKMILDKQDVERLFVEAGFLLYPINEDKESHHFVILAEKQ